MSGAEAMPDSAAAAAPPMPACRHPAARAWAAFGAGPAPAAVEALKETRKGAAYRLAGAGPGGSAVVAKRCRRETARVERVVYEVALPGLALAPDYRGYLEDGDGESAWLFVEDAAGREYSPDDAAHRAAAARWQAALHTAGHRPGLARLLPDRGPAHYLQHLHAGRQRALAGLDNSELRPEDRAMLRSLAARCEALAADWARVEAACAGCPATLVHGDFVEKNLRVRPGPALLAFDWEMAGWGTPAADLAECPDLGAYAEAVRGVWPRFGAAGLRRLAGCGRLFRALAAVSWTSWRLAYPWPGRAVNHLRCYEAELAALGRDRPWEESP